MTEAKKHVGIPLLLHIVCEETSDTEYCEEWIKANPCLVPKVWKEEDRFGWISERCPWMRSCNSWVDPLDVYRYMIAYICGGFVVSSSSKPFPGLANLSRCEIAVTRHSGDSDKGWIVTKDMIGSRPMHGLWLSIVQGRSGPPVQKNFDPSVDWALSETVRAWRTKFRSLGVLNPESPYADPNRKDLPWVKREETAKDPCVLVAILARNKAHLLPTYLKCLELQTFPKDRTYLYVRTNNNRDNTEEMLRRWLDNHGGKYKGYEIITDRFEELDYDTTEAHEWVHNRVRLDLLAKIRQQSLEMTLEKGCDFYFTSDVDNFILPHVISHLVSLDNDFVGPLLHCVGAASFSNFLNHLASDWKNDPQYYDKVRLTDRGIHEVDVLHCTYLIRRNAIPKLTYISNSPGSWEFVTLSQSARAAGIKQLLDNTRPHGLFLHFWKTAEKERQLLVQKGKEINLLLKSMFHPKSAARFQKDLLPILNRLQC